MDRSALSATLSAKLSADLIAKLPLLPTIARLAADRGERVWLVGGLVRDALLGRASLDADITVDGDAMALAKAVADEAGARFVALHDAEPTARVVLDGVEYDLAQWRREDLSGDLRARDLTINAMAMPLTVDGLGEVVDPTGGLADLRDRRVRACSREALADDPLRTMRVYRFFAELDFSIDEDTRAWVRATAPGLADVAGERVLVEWTKTLATSRAASALRLMAEDGVLALVAPELAGSPHAPDVATPEWLDAVAWFDAWSERLEKITPEAARERIANDAVLGDVAMMKTAAALAPATDGDAAAYEEVADRLKASAKFKQRGARTIRLMDEARSAAAEWRELVDEMRCKTPMAEDRRRLVAQYSATTGEYALAAAVLIWACEAVRGGDPPRRLDETHSGWIAYLASMLVGAVEPYAANPILDGETLMRECGVPPGPQVGRLLAVVREEYLAGCIDSPSQALAMVRGILDRESGSPSTSSH
ncbi:CCA tRNA nucleotidyltransferase [bacterium]|nr:CCA tRNA nucleotidyltransferase [bacterium]